MQTKVTLTMGPMLILHKQTKAGCAGGGSGNAVADDEEHLTLMGGIVE